MKKFIFSMVMVLAVMLNAHAQQTTVEGSRLFNNTSVSVYGGAMGWINPSVANADNFWNGIRPQAGIAVAKQFTPVIGSEIFYEGSLNSLPFNAVDSRWTVVDYANLGLNVTANLNNLFHHYKGQPDRVEVVPFVGLGWGHGFTDQAGSNLYAPHAGDGTTNFLTAQAGQRIDFNMGKQRAWQINVRPSITYALAGEYLPVVFNSQRAYVALQVGLTYKFGYKNSKGNRTHNFTSAYTVADYDALQAKYDALQDAYNQKPKEVEKVVEKEVVKEVPVETVKTVATLPSPHFVQNKAIVDATSVAALDQLAEEIKSNDSKYTITGYASVEGEDDYNNALSLKRAEAIKECLVERGVDASRLTTVGAGETTKFGETYEPNRCVVITKY